MGHDDKNRIARRKCGAAQKSGRYVRTFCVAINITNHHGQQAKYKKENRDNIMAIAPQQGEGRGNTLNYSFAMAAEHFPPTTCSTAPLRTREYFFCVGLVQHLLQLQYFTHRMIAPAALLCRRTHEALHGIRDSFSRWRRKFRRHGGDGAAYFAATAAFLLRIISYRLYKLYLSFCTPNTTKSEKN